MRELRVWTPPPYGAAFDGRAARLPFPLDEPTVQIYAQARQALARCLPALGLAPGDEVLLPEYHHGSEVEAALSAGLVPRSYEVGPDLHPVEASVDGLVGPRTRALVLVHHLGFPQDAASWRRWCDDRGLLLVEDAAQAWLAERDGIPVGSHGDLAVFCLYKTLGLPDGAAVVGRVRLPAPERHGGGGVRGLVGPLVRDLLAGAVLDRGRRPYDQRADVAVPPVTRGPALVTRWLLPRAVGRDVARARRSAYSTLLEQLGHLVAPGFAVVPPGASPFGFPIAVADKQTALSCLSRAGIAALDLWRQGHPAACSPPGSYAAWLRTHVVCLPVHQHLTEAHLVRLVTVAGDLSTSAYVPEGSPR